uniref:Uncharacterized protein n=1 Tax=Atrato Chu-like virus 4 TaxID=2689324 RepID=A0A6B9KGF7_9VIRU|nr:hypothetical protein [Atrato Chu-like virus 4]
MNPLGGNDPPPGTAPGSNPKHSEGEPSSSDKDRTPGREVKTPSRNQPGTRGRPRKRLPPSVGPNTKKPRAD